MNKYYLRLGRFPGSSTDPLHFGWLIVEKFILYFDGRSPVSSSPHLRPSDVPDLPVRSSEFIVRISSGEELARILTELKRDGKLPVIVDDFVFEWVTVNGSYVTPKGRLLTIDDYDEKTGAVSVVNQWGGR